ncbi:MAG: hypothetical protein ABSB40_04520 [Nitrososphaeria archaeon]|jgi:hypothetical protein
METVENIVRKLLDLAKKKPLGPEELEEAKECMRILRRNGFTSYEISELSGHAWDASTVRNYVVGVKVVDSKARARVIGLFVKTMEEDLYLDEVDGALSIKSSLDREGANIEDFAGLLKLAKGSKVSSGELVKMYNDLKASNLNVDQLKQVLEYKLGFESSKLTLDNLKKIRDLLIKFGRFNDVVEAITAYVDLKALKQEVEDISLEKTSRESEVKMLTKEILILNNKKEELKAPFSRLEHLRGIGFNDATLVGLAKACDKLGGVDAVLKAVDSFSDQRVIEARTSELERVMENLEIKIKRLDVENSQIIEGVRTCRELIFTHGFNTGDIVGVMTAAKRYGNSIDVLRAVEDYGKLKAIQDKVNELEGLKGGLEKEIVQQKEETKDLRQKEEALTRGVRDYSNQRDALRKNADKFDEELREAKVFLALRRYPSELKIDSLQYLAQAIRSLATNAKSLGINQTFTLKDIVEPKHKIINFTWKIELSDVLGWANTALTTIIVKTSLNPSGAR